MTRVTKNVGQGEYTPELDLDIGTENAKTLNSAVDMSMIKPKVFPPTNPYG